MHKTPSSDFCRHTSKKPEKGEVEGVHFFFVKKDVMQKMADGGQLAEFGEGPGGSLTGTAAATLHQVLFGCSCGWPIVQGIPQWLPTQITFLPRLKPYPMKGAMGSCVGTILLLGALCPCCIPSPILTHSHKDAILLLAHEPILKAQERVSCHQATLVIVACCKTAISCQSSCHHKLHLLDCLFV